MRTFSKHLALSTALLLLLTTPVGCADAPDAATPEDDSSQASIVDHNKNPGGLLYTIETRKGSRNNTEELLRIGQCQEGPIPAAVEYCTDNVRWLSLNRVEEKLLAPKKARIAVLDNYVRIFKDQIATVTEQMKANPNDLSLQPSIDDLQAKLSPVTTEKTELESYLTQHAGVMQKIRTGIWTQPDGTEAFGDAQAAFNALKSLADADALAVPLPYRATVSWNSNLDYYTTITNYVTDARGTLVKVSFSSLPDMECSESAGKTTCEGQTKTDDWRSFRMVVSGSSITLYKESNTLGYLTI
jgi:hypothetical protein